MRVRAPAFEVAIFAQPAFAQPGGMIAKQTLGVTQIFQHRFPGERWLVIANTNEHAFMPPPMPIPVIDKWQHCLSSLGCCVIQHAHRGLYRGVARRLGERIVKLSVPPGRRSISQEVIDQGFGANQCRRCSGLVQAFQTSSTGTSSSLSSTRSSFGSILMTDDVTSCSPVSSS